MTTERQRRISLMTKGERLAYFCGGRVTVGTISQVEEKTIKVSYVAKIRGVIVGNKSDYRHETPEAAREYGRAVLARWRQELAAVKETT